MERGFLAWFSPGLDGGCLRGSLVPGKPQPSRGTAARGRPAGQGQRQEPEVMRAQREGLGPLLRSPTGPSHCPGRGQLTETPQPQPPHFPEPPGASLCPFPRPSGPPQRKPSSGVSPWRSCCFTNVSGGQPACSPLCVISPTPAALSSPPLPDLESVSSPRQVAFPSFMGPVRCPRC